jgi:hypothetical protein
MQVILIFDRDFGSALVGIAIANQPKVRDLAMKTSPRLGLDGSFIGRSSKQSLSLRNCWSDQASRKFFVTAS